MKIRDTGQTGKLRSDSEWIYGLNPVIEAIKAGRDVKSVYISKTRREKKEELLKEIESKGINIIYVERSFLDSRFGKGHQGIAAEVSAKKYLLLEDILNMPYKKGEPPFFIILDCIEDPRNLGAILRVADAVGVHGIILQSHRSVSLSPYVSKASAGAIEYVPITIVNNIKHAIRELKEKNIEIIGAEEDADLTLWDIDLINPLALVIGSEGKGIRRTVKENCDIIIKIPMKGKINSLNVAVATSIIAYEIFRQRLRKF